MVLFFLLGGLFFCGLGVLFYLRKQKDLAIVFALIGILSFTCIIGLIMAFAQ